MYSHHGEAGELTTLGSIVKELRESQGLTQQELARTSHVGMSFIWDIETEKEVECCSWQIERLAKTLDVTPGTLLSLIPHHRLRFRWRIGAG